MMQSSLIPSTIALIDFFIKNFPNTSWYPDWYLGNPYQYLIGPVIPAILAILNSAVQNEFSILNSFLGLIFVSFPIGAFGIYLFLRDWGLGKKQALMSAFLYLVLPGGIYLLNYQNGLGHSAFGIFPYLLLVYRKFLQNKRTSSAILLSILIAFDLLIDVSVLLSVIIGFVSVFLSNDKKERKNTGDLIGRTIVIVFLSICIATFWYSPRFWLVTLINPSFGGIPLFRLIASLFQFLLSFLPIGIAILVVRFRKFKPKEHMLFAVLFFSSFLFLTIVRFLSDPDFVTDWISFLLQLQFGGAIILGSILGKCKIQNSRVFLIYALVVMLSVTALIYLLWEGMTSSNTDYQERIVSIISKNVGSNERVFLSGSSVFWINSNLSIQQVRGGEDRASVNPFWAQAAYQIREGESGDLSHAWLSILGASYVLVHGLNSEEPFHDFKYTEKFVSPQAMAYFELAETDRDDALYRVKGASIARTADQSLLSVFPPQNGADRQAILSYEKILKKPLDYGLGKGGIEIAGKIGSGEIVSLAITYSPNFKVVQGEGRIVSDSVGNLVIIPKNPGEQRFILKYQQSLTDFLILLLASGILICVLISYDKVIRFMPKFHFGLEEE